MPLPLLLIDDDPSYCHTLKAEGWKMGFDIQYHHNLEEGLDALIASTKIKAVILDGRCFLEPGQTGAARSNFVSHALQAIADIENEYQRTIPFCLNSEHPDDFREDLEGITRVFSKNLEEEEMFKWIRKAVAQLPESALRLQFSDFFQCISKNFDGEEEDMVIDILQDMNHSDQASIIASMALLRRLLESLMDKASLLLLAQPPSDFSQGAGSRTRKIMDALHPKFLPAELYHSATHLYRICSKYGNHTPSNTVSLTYKPGKYTLIRLMYSFIELSLFILKPSAE